MNVLHVEKKRSMNFTSSGSLVLCALCSKHGMNRSIRFKQELRWVFKTVPFDHCRKAIRLAGLLNGPPLKNCWTCQPSWLEPIYRQFYWIVRSWRDDVLKMLSVLGHLARTGREKSGTCSLLLAISCETHVCCKELFEHFQSWCEIINASWEIFFYITAFKGCFEQDMEHACGQTNKPTAQGEV